MLCVGFGLSLLKCRKQEELRNHKEPLSLMATQDFMITDQHRDVFNQVLCIRSKCKLTDCMKHTGCCSLRGADDFVSASGEPQGEAELVTTTLPYIDRR